MGSTRWRGSQGRCKRESGGRHHFRVVATTARKHPLRVPSPRAVGPAVRKGSSIQGRVGARKWRCGPTTRRAVVAGRTAHPTAACVTQQARDVLWDLDVGCGEEVVGGQYSTQPDGAFRLRGDARRTPRPRRAGNRSMDRADAAGARDNPAPLESETVQTLNRRAGAEAGAAGVPAERPPSAAPRGARALGPRVGPPGPDRGQPRVALERLARLRQPRPKTWPPAPMESRGSPPPGIASTSGRQTHAAAESAGIVSPIVPPGPQRAGCRARPPSLPYLDAWYPRREFEPPTFWFVAECSPPWRGQRSLVRTTLETPQTLQTQRTGVGIGHSIGHQPTSGRARTAVPTSCLRITPGASGGVRPRGVRGVPGRPGRVRRDPGPCPRPPAARGGRVRRRLSHTVSHTAGVGQAGTRSRPAVAAGRRSQQPAVRRRGRPRVSRPCV